MGNTQSVPPEEERFRDELPRAVYWNGEFVEPWEPYSTNKNFGDVAKFLTESAKTKNRQVPQVPQEEPNLNLIHNFNGDGLMVTWIGHSTILVQMDGVTFLTDPIWSTRCSPIQHVGHKRFQPPAIQIKDLPKIDFAVISHNHYDHLDFLTIQQLVNIVEKWYVPLRLKTWFEVNLRITNVEELDWWDETNFRDVKLVCTPARHWSSRTHLDRNHTLWCSWTFVGPNNRFFFNGDTAYCDVFKIIGQRYGPFDLAAIPIGAYAPRWFMQTQHIDPAEAVKIHIDLQAKKIIWNSLGNFRISFRRMG